MQQAIAEFKKQRQINQPVDEPENVNSDGRHIGRNLPTQNTTEEYHHSAAEINKLLDNPPERQESLVQTHREAARFGSVAFSVGSFPRKSRRRGGWVK